MKHLSYLWSLCLVAVALALSAGVASAQQSAEQMASYYYQNQEYDKAIELYEQLYGHTDNRFYYQMLCQSYAATQQYDAVVSLAQRRLKRHGGELQLYVDVGDALLKQGKRRKAERAFEEALGKVGFDSRQVGDLASAFVAAAQPEYAVRTYLGAREKAGNPFLYVMELATLYQAMGRYEQMMQEYFDLLDNAPGNMNSIQLSLQHALNETGNPQLAEGLKRTLVERVQAHPNNPAYMEMTIWFSLQQQDFPFALTQAKAVERRFAEDQGQQVFRVSTIARNNADYATAIDGFGYLIKKGKEHPLYFDSRVGELDARFARVNKDYAIAPKDLAELRRAYDAAFAELGKNLKTVPLMRNYAYLLAYYAADLQGASDLLYDVIEMPRLPSGVLNEVKLELGDLLLFAGEVWDASLLYGQVEKASKDDILGAQAKFRNAKLSYYNHDFEWAKSQLDVLRASTSKLIANDAMQLSLLISDNMEDDSTYGMLERYAAADLLFYRNQLEAAWRGYDSITLLNLSHPLFDEILMQKAKIRMKQGRYAEADSLLQQLVNMYGGDILADDALFMLAELNDQQLRNPRRARECYEKLILDYPASLYIDRVRKRYNELRASDVQ